MTYRFIEHTSDIIIEAEGKSFENALEELGKGMITQMGSKKARKKDRMEFTVARRERKEDEVVAVLTEIIAVCESEPFMPAEVRIKGSRSGFLVVLEGEKKQPENIIKAVTYHDLKVEQMKDRWLITVLFDI